MKRLFSFALIAALIVALSISCSNDEIIGTDTWDGSSDTSWYSADSTATSYILNSASQLAGLAEIVNGGNSLDGKTIYLNVNMDLAGIAWTPIGTATRSTNGPDSTSALFKGTLEGNGFTIMNLAITGTYNKDQGVGLFSGISNAVIRDLFLDNVAIDVEASTCVGSLVGLAFDNSTIENVIVTSGSINAVEAGGIVGRMTVSGTIYGCRNNAAITASGSGAGGIVDKAYYSAVGDEINISYCVNSGAITSTSPNGYVGGIGALVAGNVQNSINVATITGQGSSIGGIVGQANNYGIISDNMNRGDIIVTTASTSCYGAGGIVGWVRYINDTASYGRNAALEITNNLNSGKLSASSITGVGGIVGMLYNTGAVSGNTNNAAVIMGSQFVSGIVGGFQLDSNNLYCDDTSVKATVISGNESTTESAFITGLYSSTIVYTNGNSITVENNSPENASI